MLCAGQAAFTERQLCSRAGQWTAWVVPPREAKPYTAQNPEQPSASLITTQAAHVTVPLACRASSCNTVKQQASTGADSNDWMIYGIITLIDYM